MPDRREAVRSGTVPTRPGTRPMSSVTAVFLLLLALTLIPGVPMAGAQQVGFDEAVARLSESSFKIKTEAVNAIAASGDDRALPLLRGLLAGDLYSKDSLGRATDWLPADPLEEYGMGMLRLEADGYTTIGHDGGIPGNEAEMRYVPEHDLTVGLVTNTNRLHEPAEPGFTGYVIRALRGQEIVDPEAVP